MGNFYQNLIKNKNDVKFIETLVGKKVCNFQKLLEDESDFDLLLKSISGYRLDKVPKVSRKIFAKYLVMHHLGSLPELNMNDLSYISKIVGIYFSKQKKDSVMRDTNFSLDKNEQSGRIHLACYILHRKDYKKITGFDSKQAISHIKKCFYDSIKTKNIANNLDDIITQLTILKRDLLFDKFYAIK